MLKYYIIISAETARPDGKKEKSIAISDVKNKLKKRSDVVNKRGPLKAVHPVDNMQKKRGRLSLLNLNSRKLDYLIDISFNTY